MLRLMKKGSQPIARQQRFLFMLHRKFTGIWTGDGLLIMKWLLFWLSSVHVRWGRSISLQEWFVRGNSKCYRQNVIRVTARFSMKDPTKYNQQQISCLSLFVSFFLSSNQFVPLMYLSRILVLSALGVISYNDHFHLCHQFNVTYFFRPATPATPPSEMT